ncbi:MAG: hypothetical protein PVG65_02260 [Candidatus Thorarchaeota archaeon]
MRFHQKGLFLNQVINQDLNAGITRDIIDARDGSAIVFIDNLQSTYKP